MEQNGAKDTEKEILVPLLIDTLEFSRARGFSTGMHDSV